MGAAWDAMCENEALQSKLNYKNRQIREQKKLIIELAKGIVKYCGAEVSNKKEIENVRILQDKAVNTLLKLNKKK